jgi:hypothetical protein
VSAALGVTPRTAGDTAFIEYVGVEGSLRQRVCLHLVG